jgi:hypothetical protein
MENNFVIEDCIKEAIAGIDKYIERTTGVKPTQKEIANALGKFFVLKEIGEFIMLERGYS